MIETVKFDPIAWANINDNRLKTSDAAPLNPSKATVEENSVSASVADNEIGSLVEAIVENGTDITAGYDNWLRVAFALCSALGEGGREYFHRISRMNAEYDQTKCDKQYSSCLSSGGHGVNIQSLFWMAGNAGVNLSEFSKRQKSVENPEKCAYCANAQPCAKEEEIRNSLIISDTSFFKGNAHSCADAQYAHNGHETVDNTISFQQTFSDKIHVEDWCSFMAPILESMDDAEGKDKMILSSLVILSGVLPNYYGLYGGRTVYPPLYLLVYGPSASRKGEIGACQNILNPLKNEIVEQYKKEYDMYKKAHADWEAKGTKASGKATRGDEPTEPEYRSPLIPANSSASAAYLALKANGGWGIMFETEASALTQSLLSDYGDYSTGLLAAFHHEAIKMNRVKDKVRFDIDQPRLAISLTCTPGQLPKLFPTFEDGLGNRFLFYGLSRKMVWIDPFKKVDKPLDEIYGSVGKQTLCLYHEMKKLGDRNIQFTLNADQTEQFNSFFSGLLMEQFQMLGSDGISSFIFRLGLSTFRLAMVLALLRRYSERGGTQPLFFDDEQALPCSDKDFSIALTIMDTLVNHTAAIYSWLAKDDEGIGRSQLSELSQAERSIYEALGEEFTNDDVKKVATGLNINAETSRRYIGKYVNTYHVAIRLGRGRYRKVQKKTKEEND